MTVNLVKLIIAVVWDLLDFSIGRIPVWGTLFDMFGTVAAAGLCGWVGLLYAWEILDITDQFDAEVPTMTILYLFSALRR